jgi:replication factor C subunit 2/4
MRAVSLPHDHTHDPLCAQSLIRNGFAAGQIVSQLSDYINSDACPLTDFQRATVAIKLGQVDKCLGNGADEHLQVCSHASRRLSQWP